MPEEATREADAARVRAADAEARAADATARFEAIDAVRGELEAAREEAEAKLSRREREVGAELRDSQRKLAEWCAAAATTDVELETAKRELNETKARVEALPSEMKQEDRVAFAELLESRVGGLPALLGGGSCQARAFRGLGVHPRSCPHIDSKALGAPPRRRWGRRSDRPPRRATDPRRARAPQLPL